VQWETPLVSVLTGLIVVAMVLSASLGWWSCRPGVALVVVTIAAGLALLGCPLGWYRGDTDAEPIGDAIIYFCILGLPAGFCAWAGAQLRQQRGRQRR
jgi:hypothetical protein